MKHSHLLNSLKKRYPTTTLSARTEEYLFGMSGLVFDGYLDPDELSDTYYQRLWERVPIEHSIGYKDQLVVHTQDASDQHVYLLACIHCVYVVYVDEYGHYVRYDQVVASIPVECLMGYLETSVT